MPDEDRGYKDNPAAYDRTRSRSKEERERQRLKDDEDRKNAKHLKDLVRREHAIRGQDGIRVQGNVLLGSEGPFSNTGGLTNGGGGGAPVRTIFIENGKAFYYDVQAVFVGPA